MRVLLDERSGPFWLLLDNERVFETSDWYSKEDEQPRREATPAITR